MSRKRQFKITKELEAKCDAPNQFERFDNLFRAVILKPSTSLSRKKSARGKKRNAKHNS
jgi:hypothetical protein